QCGTSFAPRREHARFCSARCRVAWNRHNASDPPAETGALGWSITAMRETTGRLLRATDWDRANGFAVISEAVWWVTIVDATLMRYHPDIHCRVLACQDAAVDVRVVPHQGGVDYGDPPHGLADHGEPVGPVPVGGPQEPAGGLPHRGDGPAQRAGFGRGVAGVVSVPRDPAAGRAEPGVLAARRERRAAL